MPNIYRLVELKDTYDRYVVVRRRVAELRGVKRFRNVLLVAGLDDGPVPKRVLERALGLARRNKAKLALIDVVREFEVVPEVPSHGMLELVLKGRLESLARLAGVAREEGVDIETELAVGQPFLGIIHKVQSSRVHRSGRARRSVGTAARAPPSRDPRSSSARRARGPWRVAEGRSLFAAASSYRCRCLP